MANIIDGLIAAVTDGIGGPAQPGDPHIVMEPAGTAADPGPHAEWQAEAG
jgi:hypothetical protein